jgi:hypothetical protein
MIALYANKTFPTLKNQDHIMWNRHIADSIQSENSQRSLALNFDFSSGDYISIVTQKLAVVPADLSNLDM